MRKTACVFSLTLFPQMYIMDRIRRSDVLLVLSHHPVTLQKPVNRCSIRTKFDYINHLTVPIYGHQELPADKCAVRPSLWRQEFIRDAFLGYQGLKYGDEAAKLVKKCLGEPEGRSEWLVDVMLGGFLRLLGELKWEREVLRGDSLQRRRYGSEDEFLLNLALEMDVGKVIVGHQHKMKLNPKHFDRNDIALEQQFWKRPKGLAELDCFLDMVARFGIAKSKDMLLESTASVTPCE